MTPATYRLQILGEDEPIILSQGQLDVLLDHGQTLPEPTGNLVDFATLDTEGDFLHHGEPVDGDLVASWLGRAIEDAIRHALDEVVAKKGKE